jgi:glycosyltransferase A (GT-A) superfamily protein (DUF2064 family)
VSTRTDTIVVLAKEPRPGRVKTRLSPTFSPDEAAELAAGALRDTLSAVRAADVPRRVLAWAGDPTGWDAGFTVAPQPGGDLNVRLAAAFTASLAGNATRSQAAGRVLLIGMDTPQVRPGDLTPDWGDADAVLGLSEDGGFWAIGLRAGHPAGVFDRVPMSTDRTGAAQLARLYALRLKVRLLDPLRDVDTPDDAEAVATAYPDLTFARTWRRLMAARPTQRWDRLFDQVYAGDTGAVRCLPGGRHAGAKPGCETAPGSGMDSDTLVLDVDRWFGDADAVDATVLGRCRPPVLDLGCGPGRMVRALTQSGRAALGIDMSAVAVQSSRTRGGPALRRLISDRLPAEGRWGTVLLMDCNLGIGGDVRKLLRRCAELVHPCGLILCEVDSAPGRHEIAEVVLASGAASCPPMRWAGVGTTKLIRVAADLGLVLEDQWASGGRAFVALSTVPA